MLANSWATDTVRPAFLWRCALTITPSLTLEVSCVTTMQYTYFASYVQCSFTNSWVHSSLQGNTLLLFSCSLSQYRSVSYPGSSASTRCKTFSQPSCPQCPHMSVTQEPAYVSGGLCMWLLPLGCWSQELPVTPRPQFVQASRRQWACQICSPLQICRNWLRDARIAATLQMDSMNVQVWFP